MGFPELPATRITVLLTNYGTGIIFFHMRSPDPAVAVDDSGAVATQITCWIFIELF